MNIVHMYVQYSTVCIYMLMSKLAFMTYMEQESDKYARYVQDLHDEWVINWLLAPVQAVYKQGCNLAGYLCIDENTIRVSLTVH